MQDTNRHAGGDDLGARLERACSEGRRLRVEHREALDRMRRTIDALNRISFTRAYGLDVTAPLSWRRTAK